MTSLLSQAAILLDEIARCGSIRRAAEKINASPSAVNRQILNLEERLGVPLFERLPRGVRLTAAGEAVVKDIRRWRSDETRMMTYLEDLKGLTRGHIGIGLMECMAGDLAPRVIRELNARHPNLTLDIVVGGTDAIVERLTAGTLHVAAAFNMPFLVDLKVVFETYVPMGAIVRPGHPLTRQKSVNIVDCLGFPLIVPDGSFKLRSRIDKAMTQLNLGSFATVSANSIEFIKASIQESDRLSFLSVLDVYREVAAGKLTFIPLEDKALPQDQLAIVVPLRTRQSSLAIAAATLFADVTEQILRGTAAAAVNGS